MGAPTETSHSHLTKEQQDTLKALRTQLLEEGVITEEGDTLGTQHDWVLLRFLRARKFNLKQTIAMIKSTLEWRKTVNGVGITELTKQLDPLDYPEREEVHKTWPMWYHKTDKQGRPINIQSMGGIDTVGLYKVISPERHLESLMCTAETLVQEVLPGCSYAAGKLVDTSVVIVDLQGFGLTKFWSVRTVVQTCFQISQDYYPETLGMLCIINAPYSFAAIWTVVRAMLSRETQEKVHILSSDYQKSLLELVDAENLPESLGGTCRCDGEGGCQLSNAGPWMIGRKERRAKWVNGEIPSPGLSLEDKKTAGVTEKTD